MSFEDDDEDDEVQTKKTLTNGYEAEDEPGKIAYTSLKTIDVYNLKIILKNKISFRSITIDQRLRQVVEIVQFVAASVKGHEAKTSRQSHSQRPKHAKLK